MSHNEFENLIAEEIIATVTDEVINPWPQFDSTFKFEGVGEGSDRKTLIFQCLKCSVTLRINKSSNSNLKRHLKVSKPTYCVLELKIRYLFIET